MRISDPNGLGQLASAQSGKTAETEAHSPSVKGGSAGAGGAASDRVELSSFTGRLSAALATSSASRAEHVAALKSAVQSGSYKTDPAAISRAIVNHSLAAGNK